MTVRPAALRSGATVALVAPAGPPDPERAAAGVRLLESWGLCPVMAASAFAGSDHGFLAAADDRRLADLHAAWADPAVAGIVALRGGYGTQRLADHVDWGLVAAHPKVVCGFSDLTALHLALTQRVGQVSVHGPSVAGDPGRLGPKATAWLRRTLFSREPLGRLPATGRCLVPGRAEGRLAGGNLTLLSTCVGTADHPRLDGAIVLVEDVAERPYAVDRALTHLRRAGVLDAVAGLAFDVFHGCVEDRPARRSVSAEQVLAEHAAALGVPAVCGLPLGHGPGQLAVPLGVRARLDADAGTLTLLEPAAT